MKIIVIIIPTDLAANWLLSSFCLFLQTKNKNQVFSKLVCLVTRNISFSFIVSRTLLQSYTEFNSLL